ncbi:hypothetical protein DID80_05450 [Candidatus Marinamargulisbacteria bacterium SCGC AAA071-K20]|nr:hypothetical protein DID80_05450 [Candidatus Marinamargulisbacteria bacterium SCGC AAA071-K20]
MQSIDIKQLISQENIKVPEPKSSHLHFNNSFLTLLAKNRNEFLISNYSQHKDKLLFCINPAKNTFKLIETKGEKSRSFNIDFEKQFFTVGKRRGFEKDIVTLKSQLKKMTGFILNNHPTVLVLFDDKQEGETTLKSELKNKFNINTDPFSQIKKIKENLVHSIASHLKKFISMLSTISKPTGEKTHALPEMINATKKIFLEMLDDESKIIVTNSSKKEKTINSIYTLVITPEKALFVEESSLSKNKIIFNYKEKIYTLNEDPLTKTSLDWFTRKLEQISNEISRDKATILVGEKKNEA